MVTDDFLSGVVEGFYGCPWTQAERLTLLDRLAAWGLNTYFYAPKDDLKHRALWREPYDAEECAKLRDLIEACRARGLRFIYGLSPGLDIRYSEAEELACLRRRCEQLRALGGEHFALLFDDLTGELVPEDRRRWPSAAQAQCHVANQLFAWLRPQAPRGRFLFCPTAYCGRMVRQQLGGPDYLETIGRELAADIDILWTGPEIVSREIPVESIRPLRAVLGRPPVLWDNLFANDYDLRRAHCGPYAGRPTALRDEVRGILLNPNNEFAINFVPLRTFAAFLQAGAVWDPRAACLKAIGEWAAEFQTIGAPFTRDELVFLVDCFYLPHEDGPEANGLYELARQLIGTAPSEWGDRAEAFLGLSARVKALLVKLTELRQRELFYALGRRWWELREEMELLEAFVRARRTQPDGPAAFVSESHLPGTFRGGLVARLQRLLVPGADGRFRPAALDGEGGPA